MEFDWDKNKNKSNIKKHGIDFKQAKDIFHDPDRIEIPDTREDYGEIRIKVIGKAADLILSVIYTKRDKTTRIISARAASRRERKIFNDKKQSNNEN